MDNWTKLERKLKILNKLQVICTIIFIISLLCLGGMVIKEIRDKGLKTIIETVWEGESKQVNTN